MDLLYIQSLYVIEAERLIAEISYLGVRTSQAVTQTNVQKQHCCKLRELYAVSIMLCVQAAVLGLQMISTCTTQLRIVRSSCEDDWWLLQNKYSLPLVRM